MARVGPQRHGEGGGRKYFHESCMFMGNLLGKIFHYDSVKAVPIITLPYMW